MLFVPALAKRQRNQMTPSSSKNVAPLPAPNLGKSSIISQNYFHHLQQHHYNNFNQQYAHHRVFENEIEENKDAHNNVDKSNQNSPNNNKEKKLKNRLSCGKSGISYSDISNKKTDIKTSESANTGADSYCINIVEQEERQQSQQQHQQQISKMPTNPEEQIVEAFKKLDEKLYLNGAESMHSKGQSLLKEFNAANNNNNNNISSNITNNNGNDLNINGDVANVDVIMNDVDVEDDEERERELLMMSPEEYYEQQVRIYESVNSLTLNMEAITLESEGTRRMELLQNDIRPIFTIECQLSHELVKKIPFTEMSHIMYFESEKFQSSTQCTRFGQESRRPINLTLNNEEDPFDQLYNKNHQITNNNNPNKSTTSTTTTSTTTTTNNSNNNNITNNGNVNGNKTSLLPNMGRIHFVVWWREPGTCLNEMLGMGVLHLNQLYNANLLEQCKCIAIQRRNVHLANLYFKISLQTPLPLYKNNLNKKLLLQQQQQEQNQDPFINMQMKASSINTHNNNNNLFGKVCSQSQASNLKDNLINFNQINNINNKNNNDINNANNDNDGVYNENNEKKMAFNAVLDLSNGKQQPYRSTNLDLEQSKGNYMADTNNVRLLKGLIHITTSRIDASVQKQNDRRDQLETTEEEEAGILMICRDFWKSRPSIVLSQKGDDGNGHRLELNEEFSILNDANFHDRCSRKCLNLEIWSWKKKQSNINRIHTDKTNSKEETIGEMIMKKDQNGNSNNNNNNNSDGLGQKIDDWLRHPLGIAQLPLHPFYVAYRDICMTNRMSQASLPVISMDKTLNVTSFSNNQVIGTLNCLLAIGTEEQIHQLKLENHLNDKTQTKNLYRIDKMPLIPSKDIYSNKLPATSTDNLEKLPQLPASTNNYDLLVEIAARYKLLPSLNEPLNKTGSGELTAPNGPGLKGINALSGALSNHFDRPRPKIAQEEYGLVNFSLQIKGAAGLPTNPSFKSKKGNSKRHSLGSKRFPPGEAPSSYVTFQAYSSSAEKTYESYEGPVYATKVVEKSITPSWEETFQVTVNSDFLYDPRKRFILKIWKKAASTEPTATTAASNTAQTQVVQLEPVPEHDAIIGVAALDLTVFPKGLKIDGALRIVDFNGRGNGEITILAYPLVNFYKAPPSLSPNFYIKDNANRLATTVDNEASLNSNSPKSNMNEVEQFKLMEESMDIADLNLGQAIQKQTQKLQTIADTLKSRLMEVTGPSQTQGPLFDLNAPGSWQNLDEMSESLQDSEMNQFEQDIWTVPPAEVDDLWPIEAEGNNVNE